MRLDDPRRLAAFRAGRIETAEDPTLNAIVHRMSKEADAPIALVSLVMDRVQYFRAAVGLPTELALASATNRCDSFCQFVVQEEKLFIVEDAPHDKRVPQALVERYGVTAYAGAPLFVEGQVLGSLCVLDVKPRQFSSAFLESLISAAAEVSARLEELVVSAKQQPLPVGAAIDPRALAALITRQLESMAAAVDAGTPLMNVLAEIPREKWTLELLGQEAEQIGDAAAFYRALTNQFSRLQTAVQRLSVASVAMVSDPTVDSLSQDIGALGRNLAEGLAFVRVVEALANDALTAHETTRTLSVLHVALGFSSDLRASLALATEDARRLNTNTDSVGGAQ